MVVPVSPQAPQSVPAPSTTQVAANESDRRAEEKRIEDTTKSIASDAARSEKTAARNDERSAREAQDQSQDSSKTVNASTSRGTQLDVTA